VKQNRPWISLVGYCLLTVCGTALAFALIVAGASVALASHEVPEQAQSSAQVQEQQPAQPPRSDLTTFSGMITDSVCGARHRRYPNLPPTECAAACIRNGAHFVLIDGDHRYVLNGSNESLEKLLGTRANVTGIRQGDTIEVTSAAPMF
jgi:hypothetical protein